MKGVLALLLVCVLAHLASVEAAPGGKCAGIYCLLWYRPCTKGQVVYNSAHCCGTCPADNGNAVAMGHCPSNNGFTVIYAPCDPNVNHESCETHGDCAQEGQRCCKTSCGDECIDAQIHDCKEGDVFYDGCNTCTCEKDGAAACTEKACIELEPVK